MGYTLVYDSDCGPCRRFRDAVGFLDPGGKMRYLGIEEAESLGVLEGVPPPARRRSFHLVSDELVGASGEDALALLALQLPGGRLTSAVISACPAGSRGARFVYRALSRLHGSGACGMAPAP